MRYSNAGKLDKGFLYVGEKSGRWKRRIDESMCSDRERELQVSVMSKTLH